MLSSMSAYRYLAGSRKIRTLVGAVAAATLLGSLTAGNAGAAVPSAPLATSTLSYGGGHVITSKPKVYIVFWGLQWGTRTTDSNGNLKFSNDTAGAAGRVQQMLKGLGTGGELWSGVLTQYCQGAATGSTSCPAGVAHIQYPTGGGVLAGVWYDNASAAPSAASEQQIGQEAVKAAAHFGNTTRNSNQDVQYVIFSPKGTNPGNYQTGGFCAWHDSNADLGVSSPYGEILLTNLPYLLDVGTRCGENFVNAGTAGILDGFTLVEGAQYADTLTDPDPPTGWTAGFASGGQEISDLCAWISSGQGAAANVTMGNGSYPMQSLWSNDTNRCDISHPIVT
jgi:hypothetical protein